MVGVAATLSIGVRGAVEIVDSLLGTMLAESALLRLCEILTPSVALLPLRIKSNRGEVVFVGVGGVLTMTGVPLSEAEGGVPGGVLVSMDAARGRARRLIRSVGPRFCSWASSISFFEPSSASVTDVSFGGSGTAILRPSLKSVDRCESDVAGRLSGLSLPVPDCFDRLFLDLKALLIRPTGEGDLLLEREVGGASPAG